MIITNKIFNPIKLGKKILYSNTENIIYQSFKKYHIVSLLVVTLSTLHYPFIKSLYISQMVKKIHIPNYGRIFFFISQSYQSRYHMVYITHTFFKKKLYKYTYICIRDGIGTTSPRVPSHPEENFISSRKFPGRKFPVSKCLGMERKKIEHP